MRVNDFVRLRLRELRIAKGLRIVDAAHHSGIPLGSYSCLETGRYRINLDTLFRILQALEAKIGDVWPSSRVKAPDVVDKAFIEMVLEGATQAAPHTLIGPNDILLAVARHYEVDVTELCGKSRNRLLIEARAVAGLLADETLQVTKTSVARQLGRRDVSSLTHSAQRLKQRLPARQLEKRLRGVKRELKAILKEKASA